MKSMKDMKKTSLLHFGRLQILQTVKSPAQKNSPFPVARALHYLSVRMEVHTTPLGRAVIGCAIEVHTSLGPGLLESVYERCLAHEFRTRGLRFEEQVAVPICYKGTKIECGYRIDFVVEGELVVELKSVERSIPVYQAQMLTYLKLMHLRQGFLINFNVPRLIDGVKSFLF